MRRSYCGSGLRAKWLTSRYDKTATSPYPRIHRRSCPPHCHHAASEAPADGPPNEASGPAKYAPLIVTDVTGVTAG